MTHIEPEDLGLVEGLAADDPRRLHLESCPRCQARLEAYQEFLKERPLSEGAQPVVARARLRDAVRAELGASAARQATAAAPRSWWDSLTRIPRPALAVAGALAVVAVAFVGIRVLAPFGEEPITLRAGDATPAEGEVELISTKPLADDGIALAWRAVPGADGYELRALAIDLSFVASRAVGADTAATFAAHADSPIFAPARYVTVVALAGRDVVAESRPVALPRH